MYFSAPVNLVLKSERKENLSNFILMNLSPSIMLYLGAFIVLFTMY